MQDFLLGLSEVPLQIWLCLVVFIGVSVFILIKSPSNTSTPLNTNTLTFGAMCVALSFILSYIKLFEMPQGGSVTAASMLPILLFAFVAGPRAGFIAGTTYGFLQFIQSGYAAHWISIILDYPLAFACLGLIAFVPKGIKSLESRFALGICLALLGRFASHVLSGAIFFAEYAGDQNPWIYSMVYNGSFLAVELAITLILGLMLIRTPIYKSLKLAL